MLRKIFKIGVGIALAIVFASCGSTSNASGTVELKSKEVNFLRINPVHLL